MTQIFLINVGANLRHQSRAKCPVFSDGSFVYVPFPLELDEEGNWPYPADAWPFTYNIRWHPTHADPDWPNLTYGDYLRNPRASALGTAEPSDILLFWALLWDNEGDSWFDFTGDMAWYLIGAIRIDEVLWEGQTADEAKARNRTRAAYNSHFYDDDEPLAEGNAVFIGERRHSALFDYAVPLVKKLNRSSLMYRTFRTAAGKPLPLDKHWSSYTRSCRAICDLETADGLRRARILRDAIADLNDFDLLAGLEV